MRKWAIVLHFYQPPTQDPQVTKTVLYSCYLPLVKMLERHERARVTLNLTGSLLTGLAKLGVGEWFWTLRSLVEAGRAELTNCPMYHPVIPLAPPGLVGRQLEKNRRILHDTLGVEPVNGVFLPELAVDEASLGSLPESEYVIVDETAVEGEYKPVAQWQGRKIVVNRREVCEVIRSNPTRIEADRLADWVAGGMEPDGVLVSVNDAELFGHHYEERGELLDRLLDNTEFEFVGLSEIMGKAGVVTEKVAESTWQAVLPTQAGGPFDLWVDPQNALQQKYLALARTAARMYDEVDGGLVDHIRQSAAEHLDQGWSSCHLYWLSNRPWWHPDLVERGATNLIRCIRTLPVRLEEKLTAEEAYHRFLRDMWLYHWSGRVEEKYREYEASRAQWLTGLPKL